MTTSVPSAAHKEGSWPSPVVSWYGLVVLMATSIIAILDRQVLNLMVDPIRASMGFTDVQIGVLQGPAFMIFYTLLGFPIGWLIDRTHRLRLISAGILIWTLGTMGCGVATNYQEMLVARAVVGMGEAVVGPGAISLLADYFSPSKRPLAMSIHGTANMFGMGFALLAGGVLLSLANEFGPVSFAGFDNIDSWRLVFLMVAAPGFVIALLALTAREPKRQEVKSDGRIALQLGSWLLSAKNWIIPHFIAICLVAIVSYAFMSWLPTYFIRGYKWEPADVGVLTGFQFVLLGPIGILSGGFAVRLFQSKGEKDGAIRVLRLLTGLLGTSLVALAFSWSPLIAVASASAAILFASALPVVSILALQQATPNEFRGRLSAIYFIVTNLVGYSVGPLVTAALTQYVFGNPNQIGQSLGVLGALGAPAAILLFTAAAGPFRNLINDIEQASDLDLRITEHPQS